MALDPRLLKGPFLPIADKHVGYPVTFGEAIDSGMSVLFGEKWRIIMTPSEQTSFFADYESLLLLSLKQGLLAAFVEHPSVGRWFRVPPKYWWSTDYLCNQLESALGDWPGLDPGMLGSPVVVWREAAETFFAQHKAYCDQLASERIQKPASERSVGLVEAVASVPMITSSGAPGRPSSMHLILGEMKRRAAAGQLMHSLRAEAEALQAWLPEACKDAPVPTTKTIQNALRDTYKSLK